MHISFSKQWSHLVTCQVIGCHEKLHHECQAELENGGQGRDTGGCHKFCVGHHPAAKLLSDETIFLTRAMSKAVSKKEHASVPANNTPAPPAPFPVIQEALCDDGS
jgi:hypothetical protein